MEAIIDEKFIEIYNLYKNDILRLAFSYTKSLSDAEDIVQNVFIKFYHHQIKFDNDLKIKNWLIKVTINEAKNIFKSFWRKNISFDLEKENTAIFKDEFYNEIKDALLKLSKKQRLIVYLYYYEGYKVKEISDILKINPSTVETILNRSRVELKKYIGGD